MLVCNLYDDSSFLEDIYLVQYVSSEKLNRIAATVLLFPSTCFTVTQLHSNSFLHNVASVDLRCVLARLVECELLQCVQRGLKTSRRSTSVFVKRLPLEELYDEHDDEYLKLFWERASEFTDHHPELTIEEYLKQSKTIHLDASGIPTEELVASFSLPEYSSIDKSLLPSLVRSG